jgi:hypothetical protein
MACMKTRQCVVLFLSIGLAFLFSLNCPALSQTEPGFGALKGRWVRTDGGYVIEIKSVDANGRMQAEYYNPKQIHVSVAEAGRSGGAVTLFVELRGPGYPGSTYRLIHDPKNDQLQGIYHHAGLKQDFTVIFVRAK